MASRSSTYEGSHALGVLVFKPVGFQQGGLPPLHPNACSPISQTYFVDASSTDQTDGLKRTGLDNHSQTLGVPVAGSEHAWREPSLRRVTGAVDVGHPLA